MQIVGYEGAGKTTLVQEWGQRFPHINFFDSDELDPRDWTALMSSNIPFVIAGTFYRGPNIPLLGIPGATKIWLDVPKEIAIRRALLRQVRAMSANLDNYIPNMCQNEWLVEYLSPISRDEGAKQLRLEADRLGFKPMQQKEIENLLEKTIQGK